MNEMMIGLGALLMAAVSLAAVFDPRCSRLTPRISNAYTRWRYATLDVPFSTVGRPMENCELFDVINNATAFTPPLRYEVRDWGAVHLSGRMGALAECAPFEFVSKLMWPKTYRPGPTITLWFERPNDALLFKMRWL